MMKNKNSNLRSDQFLEFWSFRNVSTNVSIYSANSRFFEDYFLARAFSESSEEYVRIMGRGSNGSPTGEEQRIETVRYAVISLS